MPRNIFIDTPTLTSLLFAQKKTSEQIALWDLAWEKATKDVETRVKRASAALRKQAAAAHDGSAVAHTFLKALSPVVDDKDWVSKGGKSAAVFPMKRDWAGHTGEEAAEYYREIIKTAGFGELCRSHIFLQVANDINVEFPVYVVDEIGYKLSKRKEKARVNQLCTFEGVKSKSLITNLHLTEEEYEVVINKTSPQSVLDMVKNSVKWD